MADRADRGLAGDQLVSGGTGRLRVGLAAQAGERDLPGKRERLGRTVGGFVILGIIFGPNGQGQAHKAVAWSEHRAFDKAPGVQDAIRAPVDSLVHRQAVVDADAQPRQHVARRGGLNADANEVVAVRRQPDQDVRPAARAQPAPALTPIVAADDAPFGAEKRTGQIDRPVADRADRGLAGDQLVSGGTGRLRVGLAAQAGERNLPGKRERLGRTVGGFVILGIILGPNGQGQAHKAVAWGEHRAFDKAPGVKDAIRAPVDALVHRQAVVDADAQPGQHVARRGGLNADANEVVAVRRQPDQDVRPAARAQPAPALTPIVAADDAPFGAEKRTGQIDRPVADRADRGLAGDQLVSGGTGRLRVGLAARSGRTRSAGQTRTARANRRRLRHSRDHPWAEWSGSGAQGRRLERASRVR